MLASLIELDIQCYLQAHQCMLLWWFRKRNVC